MSATGPFNDSARLRELTMAFNSADRTGAELDHEGNIGNAYAANTSDSTFDLGIPGMGLS